ncbi:MAG: hypothetical protein H7Y04_12970, partial [Verrucomicrobia bacterium]|nr:hypothetical protein [Cytophagales bacterium]
MTKLKDIAKGEELLLNEIKEKINSGNNLPEATKRGIDINSVKAVINDISLANSMPITEAVISAYMRPVLFIKNGRIEIPNSDELKQRILKYRSVIEQSLNSVGRIELKNHQLKNIGTGWLITEDIIVTNRHVAEIFAVNTSKNGKGGIFRKNFIGQDLRVIIDLKEEYLQDNLTKNEFE